MGSYTYHILLVEDDEQVLNLLQNVLQLNEFSVDVATDGEQALALLEKRIPDAVISDIMMPKINGYDLLRKVQANPETKHIPFLFLTAKDSVDDRVAGLSIGADDYICKPFRIEELLARLRARLRQKEELTTASGVSSGKLSGDLRIFPLADLLQLLKLEKKNGVLTVRSHDEEGALFLNSGEVVNVTWEHYQPEPAFRKLLQLTEGFFVFNESEESFPVKLKIGTSMLIYESARQIDEYAHLVGRLPPLDTVYIPTADSVKSRNLELSESEAALLNEFDGRKTLSEIISPQGEDDVVRARAVEGLIERALVVPRISSRKPFSNAASLIDSTLLQKFVSHLGKFKTVQSLLLVSQDMDLLNSFTSQFLNPKGGETSKSMVLHRVKHLEYYRMFIDANSSINIYGIQNLGQLSFVRNILGRDILGIIALTEVSLESDDGEFTAFLHQLARGAYDLPSLVVLLNSGGTGGMVDISEPGDNLLVVMDWSAQSISEMINTWIELVVHPSSMELDND